VLLRRPELMGRHANVLDQGPIGRDRETCENCPVSEGKNRRNYAMRKLTPTLTQSGLLAVLLQRQRYKVFQLARRRAHRKQMRAALWSTLTWPWRAVTAPKLVDDSAEPIVRAPRRHTFLRAAPSGTAVHFDAKGIERVYRCYSSRPQTAR
jgi:hypothetical protein